jgi:hypothetical protein
MFKKILLTAFAALTFVGGALADTHVNHNGDSYYVALRDVSLGEGRWRHYFNASLFSNNAPDVRLTHISCNGDGDGALLITDYGGDSVYITDDVSSSHWSWND